MARVVEITDEKMLVSNSYRLYLQDMVRSVSGNYLLKVLFGQWPCTDGSTIWLLPNTKVYDGLNLARRTLCVTGNLAHEYLHCKHTNFDVWKKSLNGEKRVFPGLIGVTTEQMLLKRIGNTLEDGFIEAVGLAYYTGLFNAGIVAKNEAFFSQHPSQEDLVKKGSSKLELALAYMLEDCKYLKRKTPSPDPDVEAWFWDTRKLWLQAKTEPLTENRMELAREILLTLHPWIEQEAGKAPEDSESHDNWSSGSGSGEPVDSSVIKKMQKMVQKKAEELEKERPKPTEEESEAGGDAETTEEESDGGSESGEPEEGEESLEPGSGGAAAEEDSGEEGEGSESEEGETEEGSAKGDKTEGSHTSGDSTESPESGETPEESPEGETPEGEEGEEEEDPAETIRKALEKLNSDLEGVREDAEEREIDAAEARERRREFQAVAAGLDMGEHHAGIQLQILSVGQQPMELYELVKEEQIHLIRYASKRMKDLIRYNEDQKLTGLDRGRLNQRALYRPDKKVFFQRTEKSEEKDLEISLFLDESGSMKSRTLDMVRACTFMVELADSLGIPCAVFGHDAPYDKALTRVKVYRDFDDPLYFKTSVLNIAPDGGTRDGAALIWLEKHLAKRTARDKILICLTDGEPHHLVSRSGGHPVDRWLPHRMPDTLKHLNRIKNRGIDIIGLCIGPEAKQMHNLYPLAIDIPEMSVLPKAFLRIVEKNLFKS